MRGELWSFVRDVHLFSSTVLRANPRRLGTKCLHPGQWLVDPLWGNEPEIKMLKLTSAVEPLFPVYENQQVVRGLTWYGSFFCFKRGWMGTKATHWFVGTRKHVKGERATETVLIPFAPPTQIMLGGSCSCKSASDAIDNLNNVSHQPPFHKMHQPTH